MSRILAKCIGMKMVGDRASPSKKQRVYFIYIFFLIK